MRAVCCVMCAVPCCVLQLLQQEIIDETDQYVDNMQVRRGESGRVVQRKGG